MDPVFAAQLTLYLSVGGWFNSIRKWWLLEDLPYWWVRETSFYEQSSSPTPLVLPDLRNWARLYLQAIIQVEFNSKVQLRTVELNILTTYSSDLRVYPGDKMYGSRSAVVVWLFSCSFLRPHVVKRQNFNQTSTRVSSQPHSDLCF
ncbi:hypothetical protein K1T71_001576 [Dendrolimus kikuchii]|uniref:Uncharacterized protein n=1 Tax=Dendrolimus kikuchii TaxID=765133 RepID=A0ACC1DE94_9NEOP|nr:hypothetical protein K1T71_001576 [Dendrolimus kikuchii]